jgi:hypothetical protein
MVVANLAIPVVVLGCISGTSDVVVVAPVMA